MSHPRNRRTHDNAADNFGYAWKYIKDDVEVCIARSNAVVNSIQNNAAVKQEIADNVEELKNALKILLDDSQSRFMYAIQVFKNDDYISRDEFHSYHKHFKSFIVDRVESIISMANKVDDLVKCLKPMPWARLLPKLDKEILWNAQLTQATLKHFMDDMNFWQNDIISKSRRLMPQVWVQSPVKKEASATESKVPEASDGEEQPVASSSNVAN